MSQVIGGVGGTVVWEEEGEGVWLLSQVLQCSLQSLHSHQLIPVEGEGGVGEEEEEDQGGWVAMMFQAACS